MKHFKDEELFSPELLEVLSPSARLMILPDSVRKVLDQIREDLGMAIVINGAWKGEIYSYSGVRPKNCAVGAELSIHKIRAGRMAFDLKCSSLNGLNTLIEKNFKKYRIARMENPSYTRTWRHIEINISEEELPESLNVFNP